MEMATHTNHPPNHPLNHLTNNPNPPPSNLTTTTISSEDKVYPLSLLAILLVLVFLLRPSVLFLHLLLLPVCLGPRE